MASHERVEAVDTEWRLVAEGQGAFAATADKGGARWAVTDTAAAPTFGYGGGVLASKQDTTGVLEAGEGLYIRSERGSVTVNVLADNFVGAAFRVG